MIFFNKCCLNIVLFSLIFCNCYIIVFSLVDFKPGGRGFKSRLCQKNFFFFFSNFFFSFSFFEYIESVFGSNIAPPPPPPHIFFIFLILYNTFMYLVQYNTFYSWFTSPIHHITPYPQHCVHIRPSPPTPPPQFFFFRIFTKTLILCSHPP